MKTAIDIKDDVWALISKSELAKAITGGVYKNNRPTNSTKEDVVISIIASSGVQVQQAMLNVNVYVADIKRGADFVEDSARLRTLCDLSLRLLETHIGKGFKIDITEQAILTIEGAGEHIINNKIIYKHINS